MSWEIVTLICVSELVFLALYELRSNRTQKPEVSVDEFEMLKASIGTIKLEHESVHKIAEETKKLLSNQNLALSFTAKR